LGTAIVIAIGVLDDCYQLSALPKFAVQIAAAYLAWRNGGGFSLITNPFSGESVPLGWLGLPATLFWIVLVTNAWNLIDGLDGLAATLGFIACAIFATLLLMRQQDAALVFVLPLLGALLGFLPHNLNPARIFLGDSGSYLIGHQLALLSIITGQKGIASVAIFGPLAILGLPIIDTFLAIGRRLLRRDSVTFKERLIGIFQADRSHLHHQALDRGWSPGKALVILAGISLAIGLFGLWATFSREPRLGAVLVLIAGLLVYILYSHPRVVNVEDTFDGEA
jgi:UDP-GlcNAc:undecaprenyl-phosphate GlcNAc-1-phosphate transferase